MAELSAKHVLSESTRNAIERHSELTRKKQEAMTTEHADEFQDRPEP
jgi:hypothetical protein